MRSNRVGWLFREQQGEHGPEEIVVRFSGELAEVQAERFPNTDQGATAARDHVTAVLGEDWSLEKCGFLGYRIIKGGAENDHIHEA